MGSNIIHREVKNITEINDEIERIAMFTCKKWGIWEQRWGKRWGDWGEWKADLVMEGWIAYLKWGSMKMVGNKMRNEVVKELFWRIPHNHIVTGLKRIEKISLNKLDLEYYGTKRLSKRLLLLAVLFLPNVLYAQNIQHLFTISWTIDNYTDGVILQRKVNDGEYTTLTNFPAYEPKTTKEWVSAPPSSVICYKLIAYNFSGQSTGSEGCASMPPLSIVPPVPNGPITIVSP